MNGFNKDYKPSDKQIQLGMKVTRIVKKHMKNKTMPSREELLALAKVINPDAKTSVDASTALIAEGVGTLSDAGVLADNAAIKSLVDGITEEAKTSTDMGTFLQNVQDRVIAAAPIDPSLKLLAASMLGGDD